MTNIKSVVAGLLFCLVTVPSVRAEIAIDVSKISCKDFLPPTFFVLAQFVDHVIESIERDIHNIVARIVTDAKERQPFCLRLVAQIERGHLNLPSLA